MDKNAKEYLMNYKFSDDDEPSSLDELIACAKTLKEKTNNEISLDTALKVATMKTISDKIVALQRVSSTLFKQLY